MARVALIMRLALGACVFATALALLKASDLGMLTKHMSMHILLMSALAPAIAAIAPAPKRASDYSVVLPGLVQLWLFLASHSPSGMALGMSSPIAQAAMQVSLLLAAIWFWRSVFASADNSPWWALAALVVTGKILCLVAALLVFAPRPVYPAMLSGAEDQQLAGLIMLIACPMTYIAASTIIVSRWLWRSLNGYGADGRSVQAV